MLKIKWHEAVEWKCALSVVIKGAVVLQVREQKERLKWLPYAMSEQFGRCMCFENTPISILNRSI